MINWRHALAGTQYLAGIGVATVLPDFDFETYSEAGYVWNAEFAKWGSLPGLSNQNRGLGAVGTRNYVEHPTFRLLSLAWNLKDGKGGRWWRPDLNHERQDAPQLYPRYNPAHGSDGSDGSCSIAFTGVCDCANQLHPVELLEHVAAGGMLEAHGAFFEWQVWNFHCVPVLGWPPLYQEQMHDTMAKARASAYPPALGNLGDVLKLEEKKDPAGDALIRKLTVPKKPTKANQDLRWTPFTAAEDFARFYEYNKQDIVTEANASVRIPDLTPRERAIWQFDFRCNMRGMEIDRAAVEDCIIIIEQAENKYNCELCAITNGAVGESSEVAKTLAWMRTQGVHLYELDEDTTAEALKRTDYPPAVLRVLRIRQLLAFGSVKKYYAMRAQTTAAGRLYDQYTYYGAHTGLWNGRGVQPANLYKGAFSKPEQVEHALQMIRTRCLELIEYEYGDGSAWVAAGNKPMDALEVVASCLRSMIIAKQGHRFMSADFTAIQAVATSCMANEQWRIDVFRTHGKIYEMQASLLTGKPLQFYLDYRKQNAKHHDDRQDYGKIPVLSADFGAWVDGWKRFGADKLGDDEFIKKLILKTRDAIPNIVNFWGGQTINKFKHNEQQMLYGLEGAAISAILEPGNCFSSRPGSRLGVLYQMHEDILYCRPPSGGFIRYHSPRLAKSTRNYASEWEFEMSYEGNNTNQTKGGLGWIRMALYGGVQTQNVISHMCREIQADRLLALEARGYPVVMHTHDENVAEVLNGFGSLEEYNSIMRELPAWAICEDGQPWPIKVPDAWEAQRYGKWED